MPTSNVPEYVPDAHIIHQIEWLEKLGQEKREWAEQLEREIRQREQQISIPAPDSVK